MGTSLFTDAAVAYRDGVLAVNPHVTGAFIWNGIDYLQTSVEYTFVDGSSNFTGGAFSPLAYLLLISAAVIVGRLWRLPSVWRRRRAATPAA